MITLNKGDHICFLLFLNLEFILACSISWLFIILRLLRSHFCWLGCENGILFANIYFRYFCLSLMKVYSGSSVATLFPWFYFCVLCKGIATRSFTHGLFAMGRCGDFEDLNLLSCVLNWCISFRDTWTVESSCCT